MHASLSDRNLPSPPPFPTLRTRGSRTEASWLTSSSQDKQTAHTYSKYMMHILPAQEEPGAPVAAGKPKNKPFEPINEVLMHPYTASQLFLPVAESRHFTRDDAARAFNRNLVSADRRVAPPGADRARARPQGRRAGRRGCRRLRPGCPRPRGCRGRPRGARRRARARPHRQRPGARVEFRFQAVNVDHVGMSGRSRRGTGWRYGNPLPDRKTGQVKIPTRVD